MTTSVLERARLDAEEGSCGQLHHPSITPLIVIVNLMCPSQPTKLRSTSTLLHLCAVLIGWLVSYAIHFKSANFHFGCNSQLISQLMIDPFPSVMTTG